MTTYGKYQSLKRHMSARFSERINTLVINHLIPKLFTAAIAITLLNGITSMSEDLGAYPMRTFGTGSLNTIAVTPDGKSVVAGGDVGMFLWDAESGALFSKSLGIGGVVWIAMSQDSKYILTSGWGSDTRLWERETGKCLRVIQLPSDNWVTCGALSADGKYALIGLWDPGTTCLFDMTTGNAVQTYAGHTKVSSVAISPDGTQALTGYEDGTAHLWDIKSGKTLHSLHASWYEPIYSVAFSPDGKTALTSGDMARLWNVASGELIRAFPDTNGVDSASFSADGAKVLTVNYARIPEIWDVKTGILLRRLDTAPMVFAVAATPDFGRLYTINDYKVVEWDTETGKEIRILINFEVGATYVASSPNGRLLATGNSRLTIWNAITGQRVLTFSEQTNAVEALVFLSDDQLIVLDTESLKVFDVVTGHVIRRLLETNAHFYDIDRLTLSSDGEILFIGGASSSLLSLASGKLLGTFPPDKSMTYLADLSPDGKLVLTGGGDSLTIWNASTGQLIRQFTVGGTEEEPGVWMRASFSPDSRKVLATVFRGADFSLRCWAELFDLEFEQSVELTNKEGLNPDIAPSIIPLFSPDGKWALFVGRQWDYSFGSIPAAWLWDLTTMQCVRHFQDFGGVGANRYGYSVSSITFSKDGQYILIGFTDGTAGMWDIRDLLARLTISFVGGKPQVVWDKGILQEADALRGIWRDLTNAISPLPIDIGSDAKFYRVKLQN
jgi:WD40 repeat protein